MIVRFGPWNKEKVASLYIIISFIWLLGITILFPFYQVAWLAAKLLIGTSPPQNSNLIQIFDVSTPQLYVGCFFTPRFSKFVKMSITQNLFSALKPSSSTTW